MEVTRKINKDTIERMTLYLNEMNEIVKINGRVTAFETEHIAKKHRCPKGAFYYACDIGVFRRIERMSYASVLVKIEPFHARKVIDYIYKRASFNKQEQKKIYKINKVEPYKSTEKQPIKTSEKQIKTFSIFWGLIKFNY